MCGIAGFMGGGRRDTPDLTVLKRMTDAIEHRGPDDAGAWEERDAGVWLGQRRLAILDLSAAGHQPMCSACGRFTIVFNGEIYNHHELRAALEGEAAHVWCGHSDTETLLSGISSWGLARTLERAVGMFALALWDRRDRTLTLARDRMGEKPLYYGWQRGVFLFGSELKALKVHPAFEAVINRNALTQLLRHNYIPTPSSIYQGIYKLPSGHLLRVSLESTAADTAPTPYWSLRQAVEEGRSNLFSGSDRCAIDALDRRLRSSVAQQMMADVPLGAFLSGGIDSSTIVALMQAQSTRPVKTFTIGFNEEGYNEAVHAMAVAQHLGTDHTELYVTPRQALDVIPRLPTLYDEPFSDSSQIPTYLVSALTRKHVTVSLSGDAGDELFGGYNRYFLTRKLWGGISRIPRPLRRLAASMLTGLSPQQWQQLARMVPGGARHAYLGDKIHKGAGVLASRSSSELYRRLISHWQDPATVVINGQEPPALANHPPLNLPDIVEQMMAVDAMTYLPDDILVKVDRAAMCVSLETRVPMLDHRVVEFAWQLPMHMKIRDGQGKWILRQVLYQYVPKELVERPKMGFGVPIDSWLRGPLRDWAESLLDQSRLRQEGYFKPEPIRQKWHEHLSGKRNWQYDLWDVLMFQAWLEAA